MYEVKKEINEKTIIDSDEYINWLEKYTLKHPKFAHDDFIFSIKSKDEDTQDKIYNIKFLYQAIEKYADNNYIMATKTNCGQYYSIVHNNVGYNIGVMIGEETLYYCARTEKNNNYINFKDIQSSKTISSAELINKKMEEINNIIDIMLENNIPSETISQVTEKTIQKKLNFWSRKKNFS